MTAMTFTWQQGLKMWQQGQNVTARTSLLSQMWQQGLWQQGTYKAVFVFKRMNSPILVKTLQSVQSDFLGKYNGQMTSNIDWCISEKSPWQQGQGKKLLLWKLRNKYKYFPQGTSQTRLGCCFLLKVRLRRDSIKFSAKTDQYHWLFFCFVHCDSKDIKILYKHLQQNITNFKKCYLRNKIIVWKLRLSITIYNGEYRQIIWIYYKNHNVSPQPRVMYTWQQGHLPPLMPCLR